MKRGLFERILKKIKAVEIQGAENVARAGIKAFLLNPTKESAKKILETRPTEPLMQNAIRLLLKSKNPKKDAKRILKEIDKSHLNLVKKGDKLVKNGMKIYTHCHSTSVIDILKYSKKIKKKNFVVYTTEVEPLLQGHKTAKELSKSKIEVVMLPDLAAEQAIKQCDIFLFGADAFTKKFLVNKIGTETLCRTAKLYGVKTYSCGISLKFSKRKIKIEQRPKEEILRKGEKFEVLNPAFDKVPFKIVDGIVSEFGVLSPKEFIKRARKKIKEFN